GYYTKRDAAVIGTTFSLISIAITIVVLIRLHLEHMFIPYSNTIILVGLSAAIIMQRIPPLSIKPHTLYAHTDVQESEAIDDTPSLWKRGMREAALRAKEITSFKPVVKGGTHNVLMMWLEVVPVVMAVGTIATMIAEFTPIFHWIG